MSEQDKRRKLLSKYIDANANKKKPKGNNNDQANMWVRDQDEVALPDSSSSSENGDHVMRRPRIQSSDQDNEEAKEKQMGYNKEEREEKKEKKLRKKIRKALGLGKDDQLDEFLQNMQVEGIDKGQILSYLKKNKTAIIKKQDIKQEDKGKKKSKKDKKAEGKQSKFQMFEKSQSSDLQIPQQARAKTIYRNKDGTIRQFSQKQQKQRRKKQVLDRLAEWQKGMKKQKSDDEHQKEHQDIQHAKNSKVWNDPMRRWQQKNPVKFFTCKFEGPPNRYNIKPGFRWDGVIRGNGFENRYLQEINLKKTKKDQEHMEYMKDL